MFFRGVIYSFQEGLLTIWRNKLISLLSIATIAVSFTVLGMFVLLAVNVGALADTYGEALVMHVFLKDNLAAEQTQEVGERLREDDRIRSVTFIDQEAAEERFAELFPDEDRILRNLEEDILPASYEIVLRKGSGNDNLDELAADLEEMPEVDSVLYDRQWVETLETAGRWVTYAGLILGGMLIFAAVVTTSNIIKMNVLSRREEIEIMRLVGAEGIYVRGPFVVGGIIQGLLASLLSLGFLYGLHSIVSFFLARTDINWLRGLQVQFLPLEYLILFMCGGLIVGTLASLLSIGNVGRL
jgi:cell division transport system permease protein